MAADLPLLQIHEPGQTPAPHEGERGLAVGIDLGTTNSVVAISRGQSAEVLRDWLHSSDVELEELGAVEACVAGLPPHERPVDQERRHRRSGRRLAGLTLPPELEYVRA